MKHRFLSILYIIYFMVFLCFSCQMKPTAPGPFFANGIKIGEVSDHEAIIWVRLTKDSVRCNSPQMPDVTYFDQESNSWIHQKGRKDMPPRVQFPKGTNLNNLEGAVPGTEGSAKIMYRSDSSSWKTTPWYPVDSLQDFTCQIQLKNLHANTKYQLQILSRYPNNRSTGQRINGSFITAAQKETPSPVSFVVITGQAYKDLDSANYGFKIYQSMLDFDPSFFVHTGDIIYYDALAKNKGLARWHWQRTYSLPSNVLFHRKVASYFIKDDHDTWMNDCWPTLKTRFMGDFTFEEGQEIFTYEVPMVKPTYRTYRWGKDLQIWLVEGRDYRSPNNMEDGADKTIWGQNQLAWFKQTVNASDATFKVLISPTPIVGPDRTNKNDNHANKGFTHEGNIIRSFIAQHPNMYIVCGDRHWQYYSIDQRTGVKEFSCGPASDKHAGGWKNDMLRPEHQYLNVVGGFLSVEVSRHQGEPIISFIHHGVSGAVLNKFQAKKAQKSMKNP